MTCGSHLSARGRGSWVPFRGRGVAGPGLVSGAGPNGFPGAFSILFLLCFFFRFCFLYFFIPFSNLIQIDPNQLCKVSKIQNNHTEQ
jgi:hypothetical protein